MTKIGHKFLHVVYVWAYIFLATRLEDYIKSHVLVLNFTILLRCLTISFVGTILNVQFLVLLVDCWCVTLSLFCEYFIFLPYKFIIR
jgi:hypothetical protein